MLAPADKNWIQQNNKNLFEIFDQPELKIDWGRARILDYGCNVGNYISWAQPHIAQENYTGVDLNHQSINIAKDRYPGYEFVWYNKYHPSYNSSGDPDIKLLDYVKPCYNVAIAFSVFTHCSFLDMKTSIAEIMECLLPGGHFLFTFAERSGCVPFRLLMKKLWQDYSDINVEPIDFQNMVYVLNNRDVIVDQLGYDRPVEKSFFTWYDKNFILQQFPTARLHGFRSNQMLVSITK